MTTRKTQNAIETDGGSHHEGKEEKGERSWISWSLSE